MFFLCHGGFLSFRTRSEVETQHKSDLSFNANTSTDMFLKDIRKPRKNHMDIVKTCKTPDGQLPKLGIKPSDPEIC